MKARLTAYVPQLSVLTAAWIIGEKSRQHLLPFDAVFGVKSP